MRNIFLEINRSVACKAQLLMFWSYGFFNAISEPLYHFIPPIGIPTLVVVVVVKDLNSNKRNT